MLEFATCTPEAPCESPTSFRDQTAAGDVWKTCLPCHDSRDGFRCRMTGARLKRSYRCRRKRRFRGPVRLWSRRSSVARSARERPTQEQQRKAKAPANGPWALVAWRRPGKVRRSSGTYTSDTMSSVGARDASPLSFGASTTPWIFGKVVFDLRRMNRSRL